MVDPLPETRSTRTPLEVSRDMATELRNYGADYDPEALMDVDWCFLELARLGYSLSIVFVTAEYVRAKLNPNYQDELGPHYIYQLWGPRYPERGKHNCGAFPDLWSCVVTALFNVVRLDHDQPLPSA